MTTYGISGSLPSKLEMSQLLKLQNWFGLIFKHLLIHLFKDGHRPGHLRSGTLFPFMMKLPTFDQPNSPKCNDQYREYRGNWRGNPSTFLWFCVCPVDFGPRREMPFKETGFIPNLLNLIFGKQLNNPHFFFFPLMSKILKNL